MDNTVGQLAGRLGTSADVVALHIAGATSACRPNTRAKPTSLIMERMFD
jgi:hypothetical protein